MLIISFASFFIESSSHLAALIFCSSQFMNGTIACIFVDNFFVDFFGLLNAIFNFSVLFFQRRKKKHLRGRERRKKNKEKFSRNENEIQNNGTLKSGARLSGASKDTRSRQGNKFHQPKSATFSSFPNSAMIFNCRKG